MRIDISRFCTMTAIILALASIAAAALEPLSLAERVKAQEAVERVYYRHRISPADNPGP